MQKVVGSSPIIRLSGPLWRLARAGLVVSRLPAKKCQLCHAAEMVGPGAAVRRRGANPSMPGPSLNNLFGFYS